MMPGLVSDREPTRGVVAVGEFPVISGFALAGVRTCPAEHPDEVRRAWASAQDAAVVILTPAAAAILGASRHVDRAPLTVVLPP